MHGWSAQQQIPGTNIQRSTKRAISKILAFGALEHSLELGFCNLELPLSVPPLLR
jgi:hypothetical protein